MAEEHGEQNKVLSLSNSPYTGKKHLTVFVQRELNWDFFALYQECQKD